MELFNPNANIQFMRWRNVAVAVSGFLFVASIVLLGTRGLNLALDFTGGSLVEVEFAQPVEIEQVRTALNKASFENFTVQSIGGAREAAMQASANRQRRAGCRQPAGKGGGRGLGAE